MPNIPGASNFQFGDDMVASGNIVDYNISYTDQHGNNVQYEQS
jgi:hypothetical protein